MKRREFLSALATLGIGSIAFGRTAWNRNIPLTENTGDWKKILEYARWSPSAHNIQPWKVKIMNETEAKIYLDTSKLLPVADDRQAFMTITMAMFTECVRVAAEGSGYKCAVEFHEPATDALRLFSTVRIERSGDITPAFDKELILKRKTSRLVFSGKRTDDAVVSLLKNVAEKHEVILGHSTENETVEKVLQLNSETLFTDIDDEAYRTELQQWIRTNDESAHQTKDGLWNYCMGVPGRLMHNFFYHHKRYKSHFKRQLITKKYMRSFRGTRDIVWFSGKFNAPADWTACGTFLMRFWLTLTANNCVMHPFGSLITHQSTHAQLPGILQHKDSGDIWFVARIGQSGDAPRSLRKDLNSILIS